MQTSKALPIVSGHSFPKGNENIEVGPAYSVLDPEMQFGSGHTRVFGCLSHSDQGVWVLLPSRSGRLGASPI